MALRFWSVDWSDLTPDKGVIPVLIRVPMKPKFGPAILREVVDYEQGAEFSRLAARPMNAPALLHSPFGTTSYESINR